MDCLQYDSKAKVCKWCRDKPEYKYRCKICKGSFCIFHISGAVYFDKKNGGMCHPCSDEWSRKHPHVISASDGHGGSDIGQCGR